MSRRQPNWNGDKAHYINSNEWIDHPYLWKKWNDLIWEQGTVWEEPTELVHEYYSLWKLVEFKDVEMYSKFLMQPFEEVLWCWKTLPDTFRRISDGEVFCVEGDYQVIQRRDR